MSDIAAAEAEFDAARDAEIDDTAALDDAGVNDAGAGEGEAGDKPAKDPLPYETLQRRLSDQQKATRAERRARRDLEARLEALERGGKSSDAKPGETQAQALRRLAANMPDEEQDPIGALKYVRTVLGQFDEQSDAEDRQTANERAQTEQITKIVQTMDEFEADFRDEHPDYDHAATHFMKSRSEEFQAEGLSGQALQHALGQDFANLVARAIRAGKDPAEVVYALAARRGFNTSGVDAADKKLDQIERGQKQARSLPAGNSSENALTYKTVGELKGADFDKAFDKLRAQERRR